MIKVPGINLKIIIHSCISIELENRLSIGFTIMIPNAISEYARIPISSPLFKLFILDFFD